MSIKTNSYKLQKYLKKYKTTSEERYLDKVMYYLRGGDKCSDINNRTYLYPIDKMLNCNRNPDICTWNDKNEICNAKQPEYTTYIKSCELIDKPNECAGPTCTWNGNKCENPYEPLRIILPKSLNILIVTHENRMRCFLHKYLKKKTKMLKFKNCAIVKITINLNNNSSKSELLYEGSSSEKDNKKIQPEIIENSANNEKYYTYGNFNSDFDNITLPTLPTFLSNYVINFYIMRHGEGVHNTLSTMQKGFNIFTQEHQVKDAPLTEDGKKQVKDAVKFVSTLKLNHFDYLFASDLQRTRQTLAIFDSNLNPSRKEKKIIILQCSHEVSYNACDTSIFVNPFAVENKKECEKDNRCTQTQIDNISYGNNWGYYHLFNKTMTKCRDTNMLFECIEIIQAELTAKAAEAEKATKAAEAIKLLKMQKLLRLQKYKK